MGFGFRISLVRVHRRWIVRIKRPSRQLARYPAEHDVCETLDLVGEIVNNDRWDRLVGLPLFVGG